MPTRKTPRKGSLQFWPRKRADKILPSVNWSAIGDFKGIKGFICYKAGMASLRLKDNTSDSMSKGKIVIMPGTILECPPMKIFSARFYNKGKLIGEILAGNADKEIKKKVKLPKKYLKKIEDVKGGDFDDMKIIVYSQARKTNLKKTPDLFEAGISGNKEEKVNFVKENFRKEISVSDFFDKGQLVDLRGTTKGKGFSGPVKRFGVTLRQAKSEKGRRGPGSLGPWHPARVTFRAPQAGQLGMFHRISYNSKVIDIGKSEGKFNGIKNYGDVKTDYLIVSGSVMGPPKRGLLITDSLRPDKKQSKKNFDFLGVVK